MAHLIRCILLALFAGCLVTTGCNENEKSELQTASLSLGDTVDHSAMVMGTDRLLAESYVNMVTISAEAAQSTQQMEVREGSIRWRIMTANQLDRIRAISDPRVRFAAIWTFAAQMRIGFTEGVDKARFGDQQHLYADFARGFEQSVVDLGYRAFPDDVVRQVIPEIDKMARTAGLAGWFAVEAKPGSREDGLMQLISVPLSPISGMQGVGDTPGSINRFTDVAKDMTRVVNNLPERTRWQIELMLLEAQTSGAFAAALKEVESLRTSVETLGTNIPEQIRQLLESPKFAEALERVQLTSQQISQTGSDLRKTLLESQAASSAAEKAAMAVRGAAEVIRGPEPATKESATSDEDKFRISDIEAAGFSVQAAAAEIRDLAIELRTNGSVPALAAGADQLVTRITWSGAILIGLAFLAGLGLILISKALGRTKAR